MALAMALSLAIPPQTGIATLANEVTENAQTETTGTIDIRIRFDNDEMKTELDSRAITLKLYKGTTLVGTQTLADGTYQMNESDATLADSWQTSFTVPAGKTSDVYSLQFEGEGHRTLVVESIDLSTTSKSITVGTGDGTFAYGDYTDDGVIDRDDILVVENALRTQNESAVSDVSLYDYAKIVSLQKQVAKVDDTGMEGFATSTSFVDLQQLVTVSEADLVGVSDIDGTFFDLFVSGNQSTVQVTAEAGATSLTIPIAIANPDGIEVSEVAITSPVGDGAIQSGVATVEYIDEEGQPQTMVVPFGETKDINIVETVSEAVEIPGVEATAEEAISLVSNETETNTVVISLGTRVVVKKISVTVEVDENDNFIVLQEVTFVQDIVPENPYSSDGLIENLTATGGDKSVTLQWDMAQNVGGYRVSYGESKGIYTNFVNTTTNQATVSLTENLVNHYFIVQSTYDDWTGGASAEVVAMGVPSSVPTAPTSVIVTPLDSALKLAWTAGRDTSTFTVYGKKADATEYEVWATQLTSATCSIGGLENGETYHIQISGTNLRGEGAKSAVAEGIPEAIDMSGPILPTHNRIPNSNIIGVTMKDTSNYDSSQYPNGYSTDFVWDENYSTYWSAKNWYSNSHFTFTFDEPKTMDYVIWVPRVEENAYAQTLAEYAIEVFTVDNPNGEVLIYNTATTYNETVTVSTDENGVQFCILPFDMREDITKITVATWIRDGGSRPATLSEMVFYEYDPIAEDITALFADAMYTTLASGVTLADIEALELRLEELADFVVRKSILESELALAKSLLSTADESLVGYVKEDFVSIDTSNDMGVKLSDISPLGVVGLARYDLLVYADLPEGETLSIYPSQFYNSAGSPYDSTAIVLKSGRNIVNIPDITNISGLIEGGQLYYKYTGDNASDIGLHFYKQIGTFQGIDHVSECVATPTLELYDYDLQDDKSVIMQKIQNYITAIDVYTDQVIDTSNPNYQKLTYGYDSTNNPINTTEISLRHTLLSLTIAGVESALGDGSVSERAEKLYNAIASWESINYVTNRVYGDTIVDGLSTRLGRQNVRVMRMSATAFMYAGGDHIGIQYASVSATLPTSSTISPNNLGWGIAHEIGHNLDRIGILEVTNNIYSMMVATYDETGNYTPYNRIPWTTVFSKVASQATGSSSDVFAQLGLYWQLHLAYADSIDVLAYYSDVFGAYNDATAYSGSNRFEVLASQKAGVDLTDFFTAWGTSLSDEAKTEMAKLGNESRKIQYLNEESLALRFANETGLGKNTIVVEAEIDNDDDRTVNLTATHTLSDTEAELIQGYEVYRDGVLIGFTTTGEYSDYFGSMNNKSIQYAMVMIDKLGNVVSDATESEEIRISYDNVVDKNAYTMTEEDGGVKLTFDTATAVSGLKFANTFPTSGAFTVQVGYLLDGKMTYVTVKEGDFANNEVDSTEKFINYFIKMGADADDTRIGTYDAKEILITGDDILSYKDQLDVIAYVGDTVDFTDYVMGRLSHDMYLGDDLIEEGTIIVVGSYIGDPYFNEITIEGRYMTTAFTGDPVTYDVAVAGDTYMFATVPEDMVVSTISDGLFIFVPTVQEEHAHDGDTTSCDHDSAFPVYMKAVMARADSAGDTRTTSYTSWTFCPSFDTIPDIVIE